MQPQFLLTEPADGKDWDHFLVSEFDDVNPKDMMTIDGNSIHLDEKTPIFQELMVTVNEIIGAAKIQPHWEESDRSPRNATKLAAPELEYNQNGLNLDRIFAEIKHQVAFDTNTQDTMHSKVLGLREVTFLRQVMRQLKQARKSLQAQMTLHPAIHSFYNLKESDLKLVHYWTHEAGEIIIREKRKSTVDQLNALLEKAPSEYYLESDKAAQELKNITAEDLILPQLEKSNSVQMRIEILDSLLRGTREAIRRRLLIGL